MDDEENPSMLDLDDKFVIILEDKEVEKKPMKMHYDRFIENAKMHKRDLTDPIKTAKSMLLAYCERYQNQNRLKKDA